MLCPSCGANLTVPRVMSDTLTPPSGSGEAPSLPPVLTITWIQRTSVLAIASLICSLTCLGWLPGIICGHLARYKIRRDPKLTGNGLAMAGLIIGYATLILSVGSAVLIPILVREKIKAEFPTAQVSILTNSPAGPQMDTNDSDQQQQQPGASGWTLDVKDATIPSDPVSGQVHGKDFQLKRVLFRNGNLRFISSDGESVLIHNVGNSIANTDLEVQTSSGDNAPKIEIAWKDGDENKTATFQDGYAMDLKVDAAKGRRIPGQIYLCLPDDSKSYIAGTFTIVLPKPKPKPAPAAQ
jgi:Domain of unknown function (DUF4190)